MTMNTSSRVFRRFAKAALVIVTTLIFTGLVSAVLALPPVATGLANEAIAALGATGVKNPVTATLLNFRCYDTLMEVAVLLLAVTTIRALREEKMPKPEASDPVLGFLTRILVPVMILIAGYLLMVGTDAPGGAFQAGAILAAAGVLIVLTDVGDPLGSDGPPIRLCLAIGLAGFLAIGLAGLFVYGAFLAYPQRVAIGTVLLLEIGTSLSVAAALLNMFIAIRGSRNEADTRPSSPEKFP